MNVKFYRCSICGQIVAIVKETGAPLVCCGKPMQEIVPGTTDASLEKHIPVYKVSDGKVEVTVGSVEHPMEEKHYIEWIALETKSTSFLKSLKPGDEPKALFALTDGDDVVRAYAYCNLHGLWADR